MPPMRTRSARSSAPTAARRWAASAFRPRLEGFEDRVAPAADFAAAIATGGSAFERTQAATTDPSGLVYVTGRFEGTVDFDPGAGTTSLTALGGSDDVFVAKYTAAGALVWARSLGGSFFDEAVA